jgi:hypothetical protein
VHVKAAFTALCGWTCPTGVDTLQRDDPWFGVRAHPARRPSDVVDPWCRYRPTQLPCVAPRNPGVAIFEARLVRIEELLGRLVKCSIAGESAFAQTAAESAFAQTAAESVAKRSIASESAFEQTSADPEQSVESFVKCSIAGESACAQTAAEYAIVQSAAVSFDKFSIAGVSAFAQTAAESDFMQIATESFVKCSIAAESGASASEQIATTTVVDIEQTIVPGPITEQSVESFVKCSIAGESAFEQTATESAFVQTAAESDIMPNAAESLVKCSIAAESGESASEQIVTATVVDIEQIIIPEPATEQSVESFVKCSIDGESAFALTAAVSAFVQTAAESPVMCSIAGESAFAQTAAESTIVQTADESFDKCPIATEANFKLYVAGESAIVQTIAAVSGQVQAIAEVRVDFVVSPLCKPNAILSDDEGASVLAFLQHPSFEVSLANQLVFVSRADCHDAFCILSDAALGAIERLSENMVLYARAEEGEPEDIRSSVRFVHRAVKHTRAHLQDVLNKSEAAFSSQLPPASSSSSSHDPGGKVTSRSKLKPVSKRR